MNIRLLNVIDEFCEGADEYTKYRILLRNYIRDIYLNNYSQDKNNIKKDMPEWDGKHDVFQYREKNGECFNIMVDDECVGIVEVVFNIFNNSMFISNLYFDAKVRGKGILRQVLDILVNILAEDIMTVIRVDGVIQRYETDIIITLGCLDKNPSLDIYNHIGFELVEHYGNTASGLYQKVIPYSYCLDTQPNTDIII